MGYILDNDVKFLTGVGERRALLLQKELGIRTLGDLLYYFPFRYIDRSRIWRIGEIADDSLTYIQLRARITGFQHVGSGPKKRFIAVVADGSRYGRTGVVQRDQLDRKTARSGARIHYFRTARFFQRRAEPRASRGGIRARTGEPFPCRSAGSVQYDRKAEQRATGHEGDLYADVQSVAAGRGTSARDAARGT